MPRQTLMAFTAAALITAALTPSEASARHRARHHHVLVTDFCRPVGNGYDTCGFREFRYGPGSCLRRVIVVTPHGPEPRQVSICGARGGRRA
jgi:hypothetical protein